MITGRQRQRGLGLVDYRLDYEQERIIFSLSAGKLRSGRISDFGGLGFIFPANSEGAQKWCCASFYGYMICKAPHKEQAERI